MKRLVTLILSALSLFFIIYPSAFLHADTSLPDNNDSRLIAYIIGQVQQNLIHLRSPYYGTFFAPEANTLSYSDLFGTSAFLTLPAHFFTSSPIVIYNLALIFGFTLTFITAFYLFEYLFRSPVLAALGTLLFTLSGFHFSYLPHLQMFSLWPLCLSTYLFLRFQKENDPFYLSLCFFVTTLQITESIFGAYLIFFTLLCVFLKKPSQWRTILRRLLPFVPFWLIIVLPYLKLHFSFPEASRSLRDAANFSLGLEEIFTKYHSWTIIIVFLFGLTFKTKSSTRPWWYLFFFSLIMSLGPVIKLLGKTVKIFGLPLPLPYTVFYYLFPGFTGFRTPSRFVILTLLSAIVILGLRLCPYFKNLKTKTKIFLSLFITTCLLLEIKPPIKSFPVDVTPPSVYQKVKALSKSAIILELPVKLWNDDNHEIESLRSLYSLEHQHRRFGGFSGFASLVWIELVQKINSQGLTSEIKQQLQLRGVTNVISDNELYPFP